MHESTLAMVKKTLAVLQMFVITQFGCGSGAFQKNVLKKTARGNHWG
jgi:hypothetical protein